MAREKHKRRKPRGESTDAERWGGPVRRSEEGPVMLRHECWRVRLATRNYAKDGGRSSGFDGQAPFPNHRKLLRSKAVVVSVTEKMGR